MAYETLLNSDSTPYNPWQYPDLRRGDTLYIQCDESPSRPYVRDDTLFYEGDLGVSVPEEDYDPLTAPFDTLVSKEYESWAAYQETPTIWDQQSEQAYQNQRAHGEALARTIAFQSMKRVSEYRANFPKDTDTLELQLARPEPSSVDNALTELGQLRKDIVYELEHPPEPWYGYTQPLHTKTYDVPTLQLRIPTEVISESKDADPATGEVLPPSNADSGRLPSANPSQPQEDLRANTVAGDTDGGVPGAPQPSGEHDGEASMSDRTHNLGGSTAKPARRQLGPVGRKSSGLWHIASLSARGAKQLLGRLKNQVGF